MTGGTETTVQIDEVPPCTRCSGEALLRVKFGHSWTNVGEGLVEGVREAELCPACDRGEVPAAELLALFPVDERLDVANCTAFGGLVATWVEAVRQRRVDMDLMNEDTSGGGAADCDVITKRACVRHPAHAPSASVNGDVATENGEPAAAASASLSDFRPSLPADRAK
ncbi:DUF6300 family protein [Streptomyces hirsutus]|uniref:DUF6300 family protein n=1 Tax=Streptomyces hirsutus TaxID=35620 RepID=UPI0006E3911B|nr:DUF6300 family protein [Streptomyces hirsutus]